MAAQPDAKPIQYLLFSNSAMHSSRAALVGLPHLL